MNIIFYKTLSEKNKINKILTDNITIQGTLKEDVNIINPSIKIKTNDNFNIFDYNYCYLLELKRYYYIDSITINSTNIFTIDLSIDVLMTYKNDILNLNCRIKEYSGENENNKLETSEDYTTTKINFNNPFENINDGCMILVALNGDSTQ